MSTKTMKEKAAELLRKCEVVVLSSVNKEGYPRPVPMSKIAAEGISAIWMSTGANSLIDGRGGSRNGREVKEGTLAGLVYRTFSRWSYRSGVCIAEIHSQSRDLLD